MSKVKIYLYVASVKKYKPEKDRTVMMTLLGFMTTDNKDDLQETIKSHAESKFEDGGYEIVERSIVEVPEERIKEYNQAHNKTTPT